MTGLIWEVRSDTLATLLTAISVVGWATVLLATVLIDHFDLLGLRQVFQWDAYSRPVFKERSLYRRCRHPLYLGFIIAFWATPRMTVGHLLFATVTTAWMILSIRFEEHDLKQAHPEYASYQTRVPMLLPLGRRVTSTRGR